MVIGQYAAAALIIILSVVSAFAEEDVSIGQIERTQELIEREEELRRVVEHSPIVIAREIRVAGATQLSAKEIDEVTQSYEGLPLTEAEVREIIGLITEAYRAKGHTEKDPAVTYKISGQILTFTVQEPKR